MKSGSVFRKTMPFCMAKLLLGGALVLVSGILLAIFMGLGWLFGDLGMVICIAIWIGITGFVRKVIMNYFGYLIKVGHVAVIAETVVTGNVPDNQVKYGTQQVKERFLTANVYFAADKLVSGAVKQIQRGIQKVSNFLQGIPGVEQIASIAKWFVEMSLGYIDECCLGYTFYKKEQGAFESACDGVVVYAQNIKVLLKNSAVTMLKVVLVMIVTVLAVFVPVGILFKILGWNAFVAFIFACLIAWVLKFAFLDSYILCQLMTEYMALAPKTQLAFDLYSKLSGISSSFKELWEKGKAENPTRTYAYSQPAYAGAAPVSVQTVENTPPAQQAPKGYFCPQCGTKNPEGSAFCAECGTKL
ncbi:MAG: zinc ribbon domain-containing protein [Clostridia bacterium]|nr:zinc ribbon domain-containing protein [Clostridia bacterium]